MENSDFCYNCFSRITDEKCNVCGYVNVNTEENPLALLPGTILNNKYKIGRVLGVGGFGITYKALNTDIKEIVAIKEYIPSDIVYRDEENNSIYPKVLKYNDLFMDGLNGVITEANFLVLLKNNKNIVNVYDCFNENNTIYIVMEFLDGQTLNNVKIKDYKIAYEYFIQIANALKIVHSKGIVHRDISPQNIFLLKDGNIKVIDFGNARYFNKNNPNDGQLILKPGFSPPELYMKKNVQGPWTDIYSLAATFYNIVTDTKLPNALERINGTPMVSIRKFIPNIEFGLECAINKALELDYFNRQITIDEFLGDINNPKYKNSTLTENITDDISSDNRNTDRKFDINKQNRSSEIKNLNIKINIYKKNNDRKEEKNTEKNESCFNNKETPYIQAYDGRRYIVSDMKEIVIGRNAKTSHIFINDVNISRKHCVIRYSSEKKEFYLIDWSLNGVFFPDNLRLNYGVTYKLYHGQSFYLFLPKYNFKVVLNND